MEKIEIKAPELKIEGKVIQIQPAQEGIGKSGNPWKSQSFILETVENYPRKIACEIFGDDRIKNNPYDLEEYVRVSFDLESREFNGRWYTSVRVWKIERLGSGTVVGNDDDAQLAPPPPLPFEAELYKERGDDLPF